MKPIGRVLVVDDEFGVRQSFQMVLKDTYDVLLADSGKSAINLLEKNSVDLILLDIRLPDINGLDLLKQFKQSEPTTEVIMVTAVKEIQSAVKAIKLGAYEYIIKPFNVEDVQKVLKRALEKQRLKKEVAYLKDELQRYQPFEEMVGNDKAMQEVYSLISSISDSDGTVLIQGESGTGKELVARAIHNRSHRRDQPFVVINCAAIPATLMEAEIFGHSRGAFTGAVTTHVGKLENAANGTVFFDDIDALSISMQAKLLRLLQEKEFERVGSTKIIKTDVRFLAASNRDIPPMIEKGQFREDLFYRLNVFPVRIPPLRKRKEDIPLLLEHFLGLNAKKSGKPPKRFSQKAIQQLMVYDWPGNVRELQNLVERVFTITPKRTIDIEDVATFQTPTTKFKDLTLKEAVAAFERGYIDNVLISVQGSRKKAAEILGIHRNTLLAKTQGLKKE